MHRSRPPRRRPSLLRRLRRRALIVLVLALAASIAILAGVAALDGVFRNAAPHAVAPGTTPVATSTPPSATIAPSPHPTASPVSLTLPTATTGRSHVDLATSDPRFGVDEAATQPNLADSLGVRWTRIPFIWAYLQPDGPQSWNSFALDKHGSDTVIDDEIARGRSVVGLLLSSPDWAAQYPAWHRASVPKNVFEPWRPPATDNPATTPTTARTNYWGNYVYWLARHYAGKIDQWIIWNEVSIPPTRENCRPGTWTQWFGGCSQAASIKSYARVLEVAYQAIHAANPHSTIVLYGDPYWYDKGDYEQALLAKLHQDDPANKHHGYFDVANLHLYIGAPSFYWIIGDLRKQLARYGWGGKPIWISETNVEPYDDPTARRAPTQFRVTMDEQSAFLVDAFAVDIAAGVGRIEVYRMADGAETAAGGAPLGLINNAGTPRPIAYTFAFLVGLYRGVTGGSYTAGELYPDPRTGGKAGVFKVVCRKPGERITTLWNGAGMHASYPGKHWTDPATGITYDSRDDIVFPLHEKGSSTTYDRYATATYHLKATATRATVYDKFGHAVTLHEGQTIAINDRNVDGSIRREQHPTTITLAHGVYTVQLRGGTTYSNPADPRIPTEGGDPVVIVERSANN